MVILTGLYNIYNRLCRYNIDYGYINWIGLCEFFRKMLCFVIITSALTLSHPEALPRQV